MADPRLACSPPAPPPVRPGLNDQPSRFILLQREVEREFRPQILERLQQKVDAVAEEARAVSPLCPHCARPMGYHDTHPVSWLARWGSLGASVTRYRCRRCKRERTALARPAGRGTRTHLWFAGSMVGFAGGGFAG
jgi:transposase-like protein